MLVFDVNGNSILTAKPKFCGAVLDATSEENRFLAMKQLLDIAKKKLTNRNYTPEASEFTYATKGAVCVLPDFPAMYEDYDIDILWSQNESIQAVPASVTKVMSIITALPFIKLTDKYTVASEDVQSGSGNYFSAGDVLTFEDIIYAMLLPSSNTCAQCLGHAVGASILGNTNASASDCMTAFYAEMNRKAALIGCDNSTFDSASGYSTTTKTTVADMLRIIIEAASFPELQKIWNKKSYTISVGGTNSRTVNITTTVANATLEADYYIFGGKTGHYAGGVADALVMIAEANGA